MEDYIKRLEEVEEAAKVIYHVASNSYKRSDAPDCPHGNFPSYPTSGVWCDDCWQRLEFALDAVARARNSLPITVASDLACPCGGKETYTGAFGLLLCKNCHKPSA